jgi:hypothetical protein
MGEDVLQWLLGTASLDEFFREFWNRRPLHVRGEATRFREIYDASRFEPAAGLSEIRASRRTSDRYQTELAIDASQVPTHFQAGMTICGDVSEDPGVRGFLRAFADALALPGGPPFARLYASPDGAGFALHADKFHVFALQIEGEKEWRVSRLPALAAPIDSIELDEAGVPVFAESGARVFADDGSSVDAPDLDALEALVLRPGDCLYLPPGTWHTATAHGRSIGISVSPPRATVFELIARGLEDILLARREWREDVFASPTEPASPGRVPVSVERIFAARLQDLRRLLEQLDLRLLHQLWRVNAGLGQAALAQETKAVEAEASVAPSAVLVYRGPSVVSFLIAPTVSGQDGVFVYHRGSQVSLPVESRDVLIELPRHPRFRADEARTWCRTMDWPALRRVLSKLVRAKLLSMES